MKWFGVLFIVFSSSCYSVDWGGCKLTPYFYEDSIENTAVFFHGVNQLSIDFKKVKIIGECHCIKLTKVAIMNC